MLFFFARGPNPNMLETTGIIIDNALYFIRASYVLLSNKMW